MDSKHTEGPWSTVTTLAGTHVVIDGEGSDVCAIAEGPAEIERAHLIAAATDMHSALQDTANALEAVVLWLDSINQKEKAAQLRDVNARNRAAIAKARGEP